MKITKKDLRQIINEELMNEAKHSLDEDTRAKLLKWVKDWERISRGIWKAKHDKKEPWVGISSGMMNDLSAIKSACQKLLKKI